MADTQMARPSGRAGRGSCRVSPTPAPRIYAAGGRGGRRRRPSRLVMTRTKGGARAPLAAPGGCRQPREEEESTVAGSRLVRRPCSWRELDLADESRRQGRGRRARRGRAVLAVRPLRLLLCHPYSRSSARRVRCSAGGQHGRGGRIRPRPSRAAPPHRRGGGEVRRGSSSCWLPSPPPSCWLSSEEETGEGRRGPAQGRGERAVATVDDEERREKTADSPRMHSRRTTTAKCRLRCSNRCSVNSAALFCSLQMQHRAGGLQKTV
jgi:hypothetical protein